MIDKIHLFYYLLVNKELGNFKIFKIFLDYETMEAHYKDKRRCVFYIKNSKQFIVKLR